MPFGSFDASELFFLRCALSAALRVAKQSCARSMAVDDGVKWQEAAASSGCGSSRCVDERDKRRCCARCLDLPLSWLHNHAPTLFVLRRLTHGTSDALNVMRYRGDSSIKKNSTECENYTALKPRARWANKGIRTQAMVVTKSRKELLLILILWSHRHVVNKARPRRTTQFNQNNKRAVVVLLQ